MKVRRYNWHSAFAVLKYRYIFQIRHTEAILSNSTQKLLWFEITKMLIAVKNEFIVLFFYNFRHTFFPYIQHQPVAVMRLFAVNSVAHDFA